MNKVTASLIIAFLLFALTLAAEAETLDQLAARRANHEQLSIGVDAAIDDDCGLALSILRPAVSTDVFLKQSKDTQRNALHNIAACADRIGDHLTAISYIQRLVDMGGEDTAIWLVQLVRAAVRAEKPGVGVDGIKRLAANFPDDLRTIGHREPTVLLGLLNGRDHGGEMKFEFLRALYEADFTPDHPFFTADDFLLEYALMLADRGETTILKNIVRKIQKPGTLVRILIDRRFEPVFEDPSMAAFLNLESAADRNIQRQAEQVERYPNYAIGYVVYAKALSAAWRFEEALEVIEPVALRIRNPLVASPYSDVDYAKPLVLSEYSDTLWRLRYPEQSEAMYVEAIEPPVFKGQGIRQVVNLLGRTLYAGHLELTQDVARSIDLSELTLNSRMWVHSVIVCSNVMGPKISDYSGSEAYLLEHERDNPGAFLQSLMCKNDMGRAGQYFVARLEDPEQRNNALVYLQYTTSDWESERKTHNHETVEGLSPGHILWHRFDELRNRTDVTRAVNRFGRLMIIPVHFSSWHRY